MRVWNSKAEIDGARSTSIRWERFNSNKTSTNGGTELFRGAILENVVNCTVPAPCTGRDIVEQIATQAQKTIPIESLPDVLSQQVHCRAKTCFGFCGDTIDQIARNYPAMQWWISRNGLNMEVSPPSDLSGFDALAGKLMFDARPRRGENNHLPIEEYKKIACQLDHAGFRPVKYLEGEYRDKLAEWNQIHPRKAIHTFGDALCSKVTELKLRRAVQKRLSRAEAAWKRQSGLSAP
ncbi:MAG TPA: hypothetical protein VIK39_05460 [Candidatus Angelobacter sp.]